MMEIVFESAWLLLTVAGLALVAASIVRQVKPEWGYRPLLAPLVIAGLAFAVDAAVTTDPEAVHNIISAGKQAVVCADTQALMALVSPNYADRQHRDKAALEDAAVRILQNASIKKIKTQSHLLTFDTDTAQSQLNVVVHLNKDSQYAAAGSIVFVGVEMKYEKTGKKWYIRRAEVASINNDPIGWGGIQ